MESFSNRLKLLIDTHYGGRNVNLASDSGIDEGTISRWLKSETTPNWTNKIKGKLFKASINVDWLLTGEGQMKKQFELLDFLKTPAERLEYFINTCFKDKNEFAYKLGTTVNSLNSYIGSGQKSVYGDKYRPKLEELDLNLAWYLTGQGEMLMSDELSKPMQITKEFPPEVRSALSKAATYTLEERLMPNKLFENKPDLDFYDFDATKDLSIDKIKLLKQKNIDLLDRLFDNVIALREKYEKTQFNQNNQDTEIN